MLRANSDSDFSFFCCFLVIFVDIVFRFGIVVMDPEFSDDQLDYYELEAKDFCLVNGIHIWLQTTRQSIDLYIFADTCLTTK